MSAPIPPPTLLELFTSLRRDLGLGARDYMDALRAIAAGFGLGDEQALARLLRALWAKDEQDAAILDVALEATLQRITRTPAPADSSAEEDGSAPPSGDIPPRGEIDIDRLRQDPAAVHSPAPTGPQPIVAGGIRLAATATPPIPWRGYSPVAARQMAQIWRQLRRLQPAGPAVDLDLEGTIELLSREGLFQPLLVPHRQNMAQLLLLVDCDGSMVPFHDLSNQLVAAAGRNGPATQTRAFYFHDYPDQYVYRDDRRRNAVRLDVLLDRIDRRTAVLIIGDAGAARGNLDSKRAAGSVEFISQLHNHVYNVAWLNPVPHIRWNGSTAGLIARMVPMFELSRAGLISAIGTLRGRYVYWRYSWMQ